MICTLTLVIIIIIIIIITIIEFLTSQLWLGNIHLSWDAVINRIRLGGLICSLKSFVQLNMCQELQIFAVVYMYSGAGCLVRLCDSDFGITPVVILLSGSLVLIIIIIIIIITAIELSLGSSSLYTSTDKTNKNKYT